MSLYNRITLYEKSISYRKVYTKVFTKSLYLNEKSILKVYIYPKCLTEKSISNRKVYTKSVYLIGKSISNPNVYIQSYNSMPKVYI